MMRKIAISLLLAATAGMAPAPAASPGVVFEMEITDHTQSPPGVARAEVVIEDLDVKMEMAPGGGRPRETMIYHGDRHEMVMIDHQKKSYSMLDEATLQAMAAKMGQAMSRMEAAMANLPKAQREAMKKMMAKGGMGAAMGAGKTSAGQTELRETGETKTMAGYPCVKYEVVSNGRVTRELWVTKFDHIEGGREAAAAMEAMADFFKQMMESFKSMSRGLGSRMDNAMLEYMQDVKGYPVVTREFAEDGSLETETVLKSARRESLSPDQFEPPAGYERQRMFGG
ncbi:MAG: DUF4412 domain-containing protein [Gemmatimonadota bacterium]